MRSTLALRGLAVLVLIIGLLAWPVQPSPSLAPPLLPAENRFSVGCDPLMAQPGDPIEPAPAFEPPLATGDPIDTLQLRIDLASEVAQRPLLGAGFNLEHALWSCPDFRSVFGSDLLGPFQPAIVRVDTGLLPAAPPDFPEELLGPEVYQTILASPTYASSWDMLRQLESAGARIVLGVWGGPEAFTDDGTRRGVLRPERYDAYVTYVTALVDFLVGQQKIPIWAITVANEPDGGDGNQLPPEGYAHVAHELALRVAPYGVKIYGPDTSTASAAMDYVPLLLDDAVVVDHLAFVAFHQYYADPSVGELVDYVRGRHPELPLIVTEYTSFSYGDLDAGQETSSELDFTLEIADTLLAHYRLGADAALYWDAVDYLQPGHDAITRWGLLRSPSEAFGRRTWYYALLQVLPYLQPGALVLDVHKQRGQDVGQLAARTADNRVAVFLVNPRPDALDVSIEFVADDELPVALNVIRTDENNLAASLGPVELLGGSGQLRLPPRSLTTLLTS